MKVDLSIERASLLWAPPPRQTVCEWAEENFIVTTGANKGRFRPAAYQVEPINAIGDPWVNGIVIMAATQTLKTMVILVGITQLCMHFRLRPAAWRALSSRFGQVANGVHGCGVRIEIDEMAIATVIRETGVHLAVARRIQRGPIVVHTFKPGKTCASTRTCRS